MGTIDICSITRTTKCKEINGCFFHQEKKEKRAVMLMAKSKDCKGFGMKRGNWFQIMC